MRKPRDRSKLTAEEQALVVTQLGMPFYAVRRFSPQTQPGSHDYDMLVLECKIALCEATKSYDPSSGSFSTHAVWWMRSAISHYWTVKLKPKKRKGHCVLMPTIDDGEPDAILNPADPHTLAPEEAAHYRLLFERFQKLLTPREYQLFVLLSEGFTYEEAGQSLTPRVSKQRVKQIELEARKKMCRRFPNWAELFEGVKS